MTGETSKPKHQLRRWIIAGILLIVVAAGLGLIPP